MASLTLIQDTVCDVDTVRKVLSPQYKNASAVSRALCGQPADSWYENLVSLGMGPLDVITLSSMVSYSYTRYVCALVREWVGVNPEQMGCTLSI